MLDFRLLDDNDQLYLSLLLSYLAAGHVGHGAVGLDGLQLVQAPVQLLQRLQRHPQESLI